MNKPVEVLITLPFTDEIVNSLSNVSPRLKITVVKARKPDEISAEIWGRTEVLYTSRVIPSPEQAPKLRWIQFHWAGIDHALEAPILRQPETQVTTLSGASASQMAEYAVLMMLALGHKLPELSACQRRSEWATDRWDRFNPFELRLSTVGIVGYGSVGRQLARLLHTFGAKVLATKRDAMHPEDSGYTPEGLGDPNGDLAHRLYPPQAIRSMLKECDFVVVTVPLSPQTRGLLGPEEMAALKPSAYLIDISRGGVVDSNALLNALRDRKIAGAALDVFAEEPLPPDSPFWKLQNVILTPHIAGYSPHYDDRAASLFAENLQRYISGLPLYNLIDLERGY